jgi:uncharacterized protein (TIGR02996 family)
MSDESAFLRALAEQPDDEASRLVYADWLEERGDPRGEFLRVWCALQGLRPEAEGGPPVRARLRALRPLIPAEWLAVVARSLAEDDIREAVFRQQLRQDGPALPIFLQVEGRGDPSADLIERLKESYPAVRPVSAARVNQAGCSPVGDRETGEAGFIVRVDAIRWVGPLKCEVEGGYYAGPLAASGNVYQVELQGGRWQVGDVDWIWLS